MPAAHKLRFQQYSTPQDLLDRLCRDLQHLQQAPSAAVALDCALTFACTAWNLTAWFYLLVRRDAAVRRQLAQLADRGMATIDAGVFGAVLCEQCLNLRLCADLAADPSKLVADSTGIGWLLWCVEDGERHLITLERFADVLCYWREFVRRYLTDQPAIRRAA